MKIKINLTQAKHKKQRTAYLPLVLFLFAALAGNSYWYYSINMDVARYNEKLISIAQRPLKTKGTVEEPVPQKEKESLVKEASFINNVIKGRHLSWSTLLAHLEKEIVPNISLVSLTPKVNEGNVRIDIKGVGKDLETITRFMDRLERSPEFESVFMPRYSDTELNGERLVNFNMELEYIGK